MDDTGGSSFFFQQKTFRNFPRRYKKHPSDLPHDLRFAHLNPRVAAYLASKEKDQISQGLADNEIDDGLGNKSLLPQITKTVSLLRQRLDSLHSNDEDTHRLLFEETKLSAPDILYSLAQILYLFKNVEVDIPKCLEFQLLCGYKELTADIEPIPREWQLLSNKLNFLQGQGKMSNDKGIERDHTSIRDGTATPGVDEDTRSVSTDIKHKGRPHDTVDAKSSKSRMTSRNSALPLADIMEDKETPRNCATSQTAESSVPHIFMSSRRESREKSVPGPKSRLERYRTQNSHHHDKPEKHEGGGTSRQNLANFKEVVHKAFGGFKRLSSFREDIASSRAGSFTSEGLRSALKEKEPNSWGTIQFQLSSKLCEEKGWVVHSQLQEAREKEMMLETAAQRLQQAKKKRKEELEQETEHKPDNSVSLRYYGDSRGDSGPKHCRRTLAVPEKGKDIPPLKDLIPGIPVVPVKHPNRPMFMSSLPDATTTVFYPSGRTAIVTVTNISKKPGFYTIIYRNTVAGQMLASFTPSGRGCCYYENGATRLLFSPSGGVLYEPGGQIIKRWKWPPAQQKLPIAVTFQLNANITFRCVNQSTIQIYFNCNRETAKFNLGLVPGAEEPPSKDELGTMLSGFVLTSRTSREFGKPLRLRPQIKNKGKQFKMKPKSAVPTAEIQKVLELPPEPTENDADADKELFRLQRKARNLVDDWMEHYRIAMNISSPHLKSLRNQPSKRSRDVKSAKLSQASFSALLEMEATKVPQPSVSVRAPSAPAGRTKHQHPAAASVTSETTDEQSPQASVSAAAAAVKFDDKTEEIQAAEDETDNCSIPLLNLPASFSADTTTRYRRSKSAPNRLPEWNPSEGTNPALGLCPVALRLNLLGHSETICRCNRRRITNITDVEYDEFIQKQAPKRQLVVISVFSALYPNNTESQEMLEKLHADKNRNRMVPCLQSRNDPFRVLLYDVTSAARQSDNTDPILITRHNVLPGMFLIYQDGKLLFCDHIFNGYGNARKDFQKQLMLTKHSASIGYSLPPDFRFSPLKGRHGARSAWGGEIGGAGVDRHGSAGVSLESPPVLSSSSSLCSGDSKDMPIDYHLSGAYSAAKYISLSLSVGSYRKWAYSSKKKPLNSPADDASVLPDVQTPRRPEGIKT